MIENSSLARSSTESIERLYITMRHLFYKGHFKVTSNSGLALRKLLLKLNPEIYGDIANSHKVELNGLSYVLDRLPDGIEQCSYINLTADEGYEHSSFEVIIPAKRRRNCYRIDADQMNIEVLRGRSEIYDILTHLTFFYNESDKIMKRAFDGAKLKTTRAWTKVEEVNHREKPLTRKEREVALIHLAHVLGNTFEETQQAYKVFSRENNPDRLFHIIYWMGTLSYKDKLGEVSREISFTSALRSKIGHHATGEKWANEIKSTLVKNNLQERPLHIISSNMHSVMNMLYAHTALNEKLDEKQELEIYKQLSSPRNKELRDAVRHYASEHEMIFIKDKSGANIDVQIFDLKNFDFTKTGISGEKHKRDDVLIVMDYAFGEQAFEVMDELLKPYAGKKSFSMNVKSISIMGKAGILEGKKGDLMIPDAHIFEGTADNYPFKNALLKEEFKGYRLKVYDGTMVTVLGTSLQNKNLLHFFRDSTWRACGLEMEGAHYQKAIQSASKVRGHISEDVIVRYAYYASDNPLETGSTLASGGLGLTGVKPTYLITQRILEQIITE